MSTLPAGLDEFVATAGWGSAAIEPLPGDASFRRYFRLRRADGETAMLMHAPPPHEDPAPFLHVARWLTSNGLRAPQILAEDAPAGWVLTEDFGNDRMRDWLDVNPGDEVAAYAAAVDALVALAPGAPRAIRALRYGSLYARSGAASPNGIARPLALQWMRRDMMRHGAKRLRLCLRVRGLASPCCAIITRKTSCCSAGRPGAAGLDRLSGRTGRPSGL
jgi:hypothetical protein